jgi:hypothetical protein
MEISETEIEALLQEKKREQRKPKPRFEVKWAKLPRRWVKALRRSKSIGTYQLAHIILLEHAKRQLQPIHGEIVLSAAFTGMDRSTKRRAIKELINLGLIGVKQSGNGAVRVIRVYYY